MWGCKSASWRRPACGVFFRAPHTWRCTGLRLNRPPGGGLRSEDGVAAYGTDVIYVIYVTDIDVTDIDVTDITDMTDVTDMGRGGVGRRN